MSVMKIRGHGVDTSVYDRDPLTNEAREHVFVSSESGRSWGCMGRDLGDPTVTGNRPLVEGLAEEEWVNEIAGPDNNHTAGIENKITGVCHQCANRLLIPAGVNVNKAYGNEVAIIGFGLYGPDIEDVKRVVLSAAQRVNDRQPGLIPQADIEAAVRRMDNCVADEYEVMKRDFEERNPVPADAAPVPVDIQSRQRDIHARFAQRRRDSYRAFRAGQTTGEAYGLFLRENLRQALVEFRELMGEDKYMKMFRMTPEAAVTHLF